MIYCLLGFSFQSFATFYHIFTINPFVWSVTQIGFIRDPRMDQLSTGPGTQQEHGN